ncbi:hypothetical protein M3152_10975 [Sporosarcina luteola]|uniref:hypothetical protein n=1 Tax=Sporosarcina luteola TaxID=582850 RepID=UPI002041CA57|nr:hypothetical protein [Sporosarcina luteola]MCM3638248.1 hypothetical protein [Sporosarcina luteola]
MNQLVSEKGNIKSSSVYIGYLILKEIKKNKGRKISIYKISDSLKKSGINNSRQIIFGLTFLYSLGIIKFEEPYLWIDKSIELE